VNAPAPPIKAGSAVANAAVADAAFRAARRREVATLLAVEDFDTTVCFHARQHANMQERAFEDSMLEDARVLATKYANQLERVPDPRTIVDAIRKIAAVKPLATAEAIAKAGRDLWESKP
jgi:hypothetical protein